MAVTTSLKDLVEAGAHFGHQVRRWNPKMKGYIYAAKEGVHIFDLTKTKEKFDEALKRLTEVSKEGKTILIVGTKKQAKDKVKEVAVETGAYYIIERWLGGLLTNFDQIKRSTKKLADMKQAMQRNEYADRTKKERLLIDREIQRLERFFGGVATMDKQPDVMVIIDTRKELGAAKEARAMGVETIGVVDTNSDPTLVDYVIPMNDDASRAVEYALDLIKEAILEGQGKGSKKEEKPKVEKVVVKKKTASKASTK